MAGQTSGQMSDETLDAIIELQRVELTRLLAEIKRNHEETDRLLKIVAREQVLRQQMQNQIEGLTERLALPTPETRHLESRLGETEGNLGLLQQALWKLVIFLEGKQAK